ncbi:unnamed protein product [Urochloa humidicola]
MTALSPAAPAPPASSSVASAPSTMRPSPRIAPSQSNPGHVAAARGCCTGILHLLEDHLIPSAAAVDANVFHLKMEGDYHLYLAERNATANSTLAAYQAAQVPSPSLSTSIFICLAPFCITDLTRYSWIGSRMALVFLSPGQFHEGAAGHAPHQAASPIRKDEEVKQHFPSDSPTTNTAELLYFYHMKDEGLYWEEKMAIFLLPS